VQEAVRWRTQANGQRQGWGHVQFKSEAEVKAAIALSGQSFMGRPVEVHPASDNGQHKLNLGAPVKDCWFCLSNDEVRQYVCPTGKATQQVCKKVCSPGVPRPHETLHQQHKPLSQ
jgi:RNA recognition motif-containing protein